MAARAVIFGCAGTELAESERRFFAEADPWGFIVFARNIEAPDQLSRLTADLRASVGRDAPVLIDQEGGRVARMRGPAWLDWVSAFDECERLADRAARIAAMRLRYRLIAEELRAVGIDVNCTPVLDVAGPDTHGILRDRCYASVPTEVAAIGRAVADALLSGGVLPVMKHMPGQGRAGLDSHEALPEVEADAETLAADFAPFADLADLPMAMTAHVVYRALDPDAPATQSEAVIGMMRERIGFDGLLLTDDLSMRALTGPFAERAARSVAAGCDVVLHCNGDADEMAAVAEGAPRLEGRAAERADRALAVRGGRVEADVAALAAEYADLTGRVAHA